MESFSFKSYCDLCQSLAAEPSYNSKTALVKAFIADHAKGLDSKAMARCMSLLIKLLLPAAENRIYNLQDRQLVKLFSQVFAVSSADMTAHLEDQGNISDTVKEFFKQSSSDVLPAKLSTLTLEDVEKFLDGLSLLTKSEDQLTHLREISTKCTPDDLCFVVRLIKRDLRMNTGNKHVLDALDANAYAAYQASSSLQDVVEKWCLKKTSELPCGSGISPLKKTLSIKAKLMTPVKPMLAEACKSVEHAFRKCPNGIYSEIKYDGERVQIHKDGNNFQFFSRSLKPVQPHKISDIKEYIKKACPLGDNLILDGEVLLIDTKTGKPLPFGTLGVHKKTQFKDANVCYFIFDILQLNNKNLLNCPLRERRDILMDNIKQIDNRIMHSEMTEVSQPEDLQAMLKKCFSENLEGLVLKDKESLYEPGKRHWLKMKKDYLEDGALADTADLVVLGAYYGTGNKGGMMSVFLMGCYDPVSKKWLTVAKCGNGHDDDTIQRLQDELDVIKIGKDFNQVPDWLKVSRSLVPDFVVADPKVSPVWEITGAEFSKSANHTADGISIRFPRVTKIRDDKDWTTATDFADLKKLFSESKKTAGQKERDEDDGNDNPASDNESSLRSAKAHQPLNASAVRSCGDDVPSEAKKMDKPDPASIKEFLHSHGVSGKRKSDTSPDVPIPAKKTKKPKCPYGASCYRKKKDHFEEFHHDVPTIGSPSIKKNEDGSPSTKTKHDTQQSTTEASCSKERLVPDAEKIQSSVSLESFQLSPLADVFTDLKFVIHDSLKDELPKLRRYIIAFDGDTLEANRLNEATHIVTTQLVTPVGDDCSAVQVKPEWIWSCIKNKGLVRISEQNAFDI